MGLRETRIPDQTLLHKLGAVRSNGNGEKVIRWNWKVITGVVSLVVLAFSIFTAATSWVIRQTETTKTVEQLCVDFDTRKKTVDTIVSEVVIIQEANRTLLKGLVRQTLPETKAEQLIKASDEQAMVLMARLAKGQE